MPKPDKTKTAPRISAGLFGRKTVKLQFYNVFCLWSTVALNNVELNALAFVKRFETFAYDCGEMYEYIVAAFNFDETEAFLSVKPFNCSCLHGEIPP